jgi:hypothetical protein
MLNPSVLVEVLRPSTADMIASAPVIAELEAVDCRLDVSELYRDPLSAT